MSLQPGSQIGPYAVVSRVGAGGMGEVYRARDARLNREVAIKILPEAFASDRERLARFEREAQALAAVSHPNIASIYGLEESSSAAALVMELVPGETLAERLVGGPLPVSEAVDIARQISLGLEAAHEQGIVHRDLKPANLKITPDGQVKILDFGLARITEAGSADIVSAHSPTMSLAATQAGLILGTAAYMSPEQVRGKWADRRADMWAFGCVLFEMLAGRQPFAGDTVNDLLAAVVSEEPDWKALPPEIPAGIRRVIERCLRKDPRQRLHDIADARLDLEDALGAPAPGPMAEPSPAWQRLVPWALAVVLAMALGVQFWRGARHEIAAPVRFSVLPPPEFEFHIAEWPVRCSRPTAATW